MCTCMYMYFHTRYALLTPETYPHWNGPVQEGIRHLMMSVNMEPDQWQLGKTKVFIKSPESVSLHYLWHSVTNLSLSFSLSLFHPYSLFYSVDSSFVMLSLCCLVVFT